MVRAVFFDFYSVWAPDRFAEYLALAREKDPQAAQELADVVQNYFFGSVDVEYVADSFRFKLGRSDIDASLFTLGEEDISPKVVEFMQSLHGHFLKVGILASLGRQEYEILNNFNTRHQLFETIAGPLPFGLPLPLLSQEVFAKALQAIGEPPRSCLVVSGHDDYRQFAEKLGIASLPFEGFPKLRQQLDQIVSSPS